jgi:spore coat protein A
MRFKVKATATVAADAPLGINNTTDLTGGIDPALLPWASIASPTFAIPSNIPRRFLTLNEYSDEYGRLVQIIGNAGAAYGSPYDATAPYLGYGPFPGAPATVGSTYEGVNEGTTEIWEVYNTTGDVHPMHIHLATAQLLNRQTFTAVNTFSSAPVPPDANELGWKETIPMYPGTVTRFIVNWDAQKASIVDKKLRPITTSGKTDSQLPIVNGLPPLSPRTGGYEYVWHCHILEHEEHDMMHALVVTPKPPLK